MDKTERLFSIMDTLRRHRQPVTAAALAEEQGVSVRTLYRDVQTLIGLGAPIDGEAGVGYVLRPGFFLPPLMFSPEELEALVLGARWVQGRPDESLSLAATKALGKIATASPEDLRDRIETSGLWAAQASWSQDKEPLLAVIREAMRIEKALVISYGDEAGRVSRRTIWPVTLAYYEEKQIVGAWCTTRQAFRNFRVDRIQQAEQGEDRFGKRRVILLKEWEAVWRAEAEERRRLASSSS
ncbi:Transcriptional regulator, DeoR family [Devosia sp. DBB001]|nr:Transcriptional regulator, DeoR family [Devosia sp. DBB001]